MSNSTKEMTEPEPGIAARAEARRHRFQEQLYCRKNDSAPEAFDRTFWAAAGAEAKFAAAWEMLQEIQLFKGETDAGQPRLQRSVQHIQRRRG